MSVFGLFVSSDYFQVMAADAIVGRSFETADDHLTAAPYPAMLSENFWERRFGRDPQVIGMSMSFSGVQSVIVGITPRDFMGARPEVPDVWLPLGARGAQRTCCVLEGRLKPGVTMEQAEAELNQLANSSPSNLPSYPRWRVSVTRALPGFFKGSKFSSAGPRLIIFSLFQVAIGSVLLIACANVAGLLLSRAMARHKEIAVRLSLGASRSRLVRQLLTEAFVIAQLAGLLSVAMTWWILKVAVRWTLSAIDNAGLSAGGTVLVNVAPDMKVFFYAFGISTVTAVGFALLPALQATKINLTESLNNEVPALGGNRRSWLRSWTTGAQVAVCLMLMIAAGTLVRSSSRLLTTDPGFHPDHVLTISVLDPAQLGYSANFADAVRHELRDQLTSLPGVESIATASRIPLAGLVTRTTIVPAALASAPDSFRLERYPYSFVSTGYFETLRIPILHGRSFSEQEIAGRAPVVVISESLSRNLWPGQDAIGKTVRIGAPAQLSRKTVSGSEIDRQQSLAGIQNDEFGVGARHGILRAANRRDCVFDDWNAGPHPRVGRNLQHGSLRGRPPETRDRHTNGAGSAESGCAATYHRAKYAPHR
jgi:predicted permease